jgi:hypothetical protein
MGYQHFAILRMPVERGAKTVPEIKFSERSDMNSKRYAHWTFEAFMGAQCFQAKHPFLVS